VAEEQDSVCTGIELGDLYECDESDDAECDLCGKAGGIMQFFDLQSRYFFQILRGVSISNIVLNVLQFSSQYTSFKIID
jgi:hypothetical protein